jgi:hypothetical protein
MDITIGQLWITVVTYLLEALLKWDGKRMLKKRTAMLVSDDADL